MSPDELRQRFPNASASFLQLNAAAVPAGDTQRPEGDTLERPAPREETRSDCGPVSPASRARLSVRVFAVRPADADGWHLKELIDVLVHAQILDGDAWHQLELSVTSEKVHRPEEEKTELLIEWPKMTSQTGP